MRDSSSDTTGVWLSVEVGWPVQCLPTTVEIVRPRKLTALEWAVLRVVDDFRPDLPPLDEVAQELGLDTPVFLQDAVQAAVRLRALQAAVAGDMPTWPALQFTQFGYELYRKGQIESEPSRHAHTFCFDALTDADLPLPPRLSVESARPIVSPEVVEPVYAIGLDRARKVLARNAPDLVSQAGIVRGLLPAEDGLPDVKWLSVVVNLRVDPDGHVRTDAPALHAAGRKHLSALDLYEADLVPARAVTSEWSSAPSRLPLEPPVPFDLWRSVTTTIVPAADTATAALQLVHRAHAEVILSSTWLGVPGMSRALNAAVQRGKRVLVVGTEDEVAFAWFAGPRPGVGLQARLTDPLGGALIADGKSGLVLADVLLASAGGSQPVELAGVMTPEHAAKVRRELIDAAWSSRTTMLAEDGVGPEFGADPEAAVASIREDADIWTHVGLAAFFPEFPAWSAMSTSIQRRSSGLARLAVSHEVVNWLRAVAPSLDEAAVNTDLDALWRHELAASVQAGRRLQAPELALLARLAPRAVTAAEFVEQAARGWLGSPPYAASRDAAFGLIAIGDGAAVRWGREQVRALSFWRDTLLTLLAPVATTPLALAEAATTAREILTSAELEQWVSLRLKELAWPGSLEDYREWHSRLSALQLLAPGVVKERAFDGWTQVVARDPAQVLAAVRAAAGVLPLARAVDHLLGKSATIQDIGKLREEIRSLGISDDEDAAWNRRVHAALPPIEGGYRSREQAVLVTGVVGSAAAWPWAQAMVDAWLRGIVLALPAPKAESGLPAWLRELASLRQVASKADIERRVAEQFRAHRGALIDARQRGTLLWQELARSVAEMPHIAEMMESMSKSDQGRAVQPRPSQKEKRRR